jgi:membrane protease YdiL (CAAX protease family)
MWLRRAQQFDIHSESPKASLDAKSDSATSNNPVAPAWHTGLIIVALGINAYRGFMRSASFRDASTVDRPVLYLRTIAIEWLFMALVLGGVWLHKSSISSVVGERWRSLRQFFRDFGIAFAFLIVSVFVTSILGAHSHQGGVDPALTFLMPQNLKERWLWVFLAISAGICEEAVYRGYLQHQLIAFSKNVPLGIILSAALFGASHAYQGLRSALIIFVGGGLAGALAWWRRSVRPGMIAHALQDILAVFVAH